MATATARRLRFMGRRKTLQGAHAEDPMSTMGNLIDVMLLLAVGLFIMALSSFGLGDLLTKDDTTVITNPGKPNQTITTRTNGEIKMLSGTGNTASGQGVPVGMVYRLDNGQYVWVPQTTAP